MNSFLNFWGVNEEIGLGEIVLRALTMFVVTVLMIRITGMRSFRKNSPFDLVIAVLLGGILSRGVVGATPFLSSVCGGIALLLLQKLFSKLTVHFRGFERSAKGDKILIFQNGQFLRENMKLAGITVAEVFEDVRVEFHIEKLSAFSEIYVEKTGEVSFIKKPHNDLRSSSK